VGGQKHSVKDSYQTIEAKKQGRRTAKGRKESEGVIFAYVFEEETARRRVREDGLEGAIWGRRPSRGRKRSTGRGGGFEKKGL